MAWSRVFTFASALCLITAFGSVSYGEHTPESRRADISGMPPWCCSKVDCKEAEVRFLRYDGNFGIVWADGREWRVVGRFNHGENGLYVSPNDKTFYCPIGLGIARCAMVKPKAVF